jgi:hypothetical protein
MVNVLVIFTITRGICPFLLALTGLCITTQSTIVHMILRGSRYNPVANTQEFDCWNRPGRHISH